MKLSHAILKGSQETYQIRGHMNNGEGGTCAIGSVFHAIEVNPYGGFDSYSRLFNVYPILRQRVADNNDHSGKATISLLDTIIRLNDKFGWTRERIAKWLRSHGH